MFIKRATSEQLPAECMLSTGEEGKGYATGSQPVSRFALSCISTSRRFEADASVFVMAASCLSSKPVIEGLDFEPIASCRRLLEPAQGQCSLKVAVGGRGLTLMDVQAGIQIRKL